MKGVHRQSTDLRLRSRPKFSQYSHWNTVIDLNRAVVRNASRNEEVAAIGEITRTYVNNHDEAVFEIANEAFAAEERIPSHARPSFPGIINKKFADSPFPIDRIPIGGRKRAMSAGDFVGFARERHIDHRKRRGTASRRTKSGAAILT